MTLFERFRVLTYGQIRQGEAKCASFGTFHRGCAKYHNKDKLLSYSDDDDSVDPSKQTKIFMNFVYWNINPRNQPTKVTDLVYLPMFFVLNENVENELHSHYDRDCTTYCTTSTNKSQIKILLYPVFEV
jgi:hypothetical protein